MTGIVSYGTYIPKYRIKLSEIANVWQKVPEEITGGLRVAEKAVAGIDEDSVTMGIEAGKKRLIWQKLTRQKSAVYILDQKAIHMSSILHRQLLPNI